MPFQNHNKKHRRIGPVLCATIVILIFADSASAQGRLGGPPPNEPESRGLLINDEAATEGYTLFAPLNGNKTYLIDMGGRVVREWASELVPSAWIYMLNNGDVLRGGKEPETSGFSGGGQGGRFERFTFDGERIWNYSLNTGRQLPHHDVAVLPNGNLLALVWEYRGPEATRAAGRREGFIPDDGIWGDAVIELKPDGPDGAELVWEWHVWDHLIQNTDPALQNFGEPADYPGRIDINGDTVGRTGPQGAPTQDVFHLNSVDYNEHLDQIIISSPTFNEVWIVDHSGTSTAAAGQAGDLLYRWGNPQLYGRGTADDRRLGFQHDAKWIADGLPGAGHLMIFSNRSPGGSGSGGTTTVLELAPPVNNQGRYRLADRAPYGPVDTVWQYSADDFNAGYISGAVRLWSGNTLISSGPQGRMFEVEPDGKIVWEYWSPYGPDTDAEGAAARNPYAIFRAIRIPPDHPGLAGHDLSPGVVQ